MKKQGFIITAIIFMAIIGYVNFFATKSQPTSKVTVKAQVIPIIDPGHGGVDGGATSLSGVLESEINLQIALKTELIFRFLGYQPKMTREIDISLHDNNARTIREKKRSDLQNRVNFVNSVDNGVLISIHQNIFSQNQYFGAQTFYNANSESKILAEYVKLSLKSTLDPNNKREIKKANDVYLMENVKNCAILVECGFLSNPKEEKLLRDKAYQVKIALAISSGFVNWQYSD